MATRTRAERFRTDLTQMNVHLDIGSAVTSATTGEPILHTRSREISLLLARDDLTITEARYAAGEPIAGPHIHNHHTDAFYVLEG